MRIAVKPVSSIAVPQRTIDKDGKEHVISIKGRHDVCAAVRIVPVAKAMAWLTLADFVLLSKASKA
jgi:chorismate synthase